MRAVAHVALFATFVTGCTRSPAHSPADDARASSLDSVARNTAQSPPAADPSATQSAPSQAAPTLADAAADAAPLVRWTRTRVVRPVVESDDAPDGGDNSAPAAAALAALPGGGAIAFWTDPPDEHNRTAVYARALDADGRWQGPPRHVITLGGNVDRLVADALGPMAWLGFEVTRPRSWSAEVLAVRPDLSAVSNPVTLQTVPSVDAEHDRFLSLLAADDGGAWVLSSGRFHEITDVEMRRMERASPGGAPGGQPPFDWTLVRLNPDHVPATVVAAHATDVDVMKQGIYNEDGTTERGTLVRGPSGSVHYFVVTGGREYTEGWAGIDVPSRPYDDPFGFNETDYDEFAQAFTGDAVVALGHEPGADGGRGTIRAWTLRLSPHGTALDAGAQFATTLTRPVFIAEPALTCADGKPRVHLAWRGGGIDVDPIRPDAFVHLGEFMPPDPIAQDRSQSAGVAWVGRALVKFDGRVPQRWVCLAPDGPLAPAPP